MPLMRSGVRRNYVKCPNCSKSTINFRQWRAADNALNWICPHCFAGLRATLRTKIAFAIFILFTIAIVVAVILVEDNSLIPEGKERLLLGLAFLLILYPAAFLVFRYIAGYYIDSYPKKRDLPAADEEYRDIDP